MTELKKTLLGLHARTILARVISGGQTGVDQAALVVAHDQKIPTGGWAADNYMTESGPRMFLGQFGLREGGAYPERTLRNVLDSDMTLLLGNMTGGTKATALICMRFKRPALFLSRDDLYREAAMDRAFDRIKNERIRRARAIVLNVAGNRESKVPGIGEAAEHFLGIVFKRIVDAQRKES